MHDTSAQDELDDALDAAIRAGSLKAVKRLLAAGADPNHLVNIDGQSPLYLAAELGLADLATALLGAGANPDGIVNGVRPLIAASLAGHHGVAKLIRDASQTLTKDRTKDHFDRLGWSLGDFENQFHISGSERIDHPEEIISSALVDVPVPLGDIPFTSFDGWTKQIALDRILPIGLDALEAALPLFVDLSVPPESLMAKIHQRNDEQHRFTGMRTRRFAGDNLLPRSRYYTLCADETGDDGGTLLSEMWAYSHIARTGAITLIDTTAPTAPKEIKRLGLEGLPSGHSVLLVFLAGPGSGLSPYLLRSGLPQGTIAVPLTVNVQQEHIERVIDLRIPHVANWFTRVVSSLTFETYNRETDTTRYFKCWPRRPGLHSFADLLPAMLNQSHGGGVFSTAVGALLRQIRAAALIYPSARNDPFVLFRDGQLRRSEGWNLVDYRNAPPPKQMFILDTDHDWPTKVQMERGRGRELFEIVSIGYERSGRKAGSFEVSGIAAVHNRIREIELEAFRNDEFLNPWWLA